jgi:hypothetical protein
VLPFSQIASFVRFCYIYRKLICMQDCMLVKKHAHKSKQVDRKNKDQSLGITDRVAMHARSRLFDNSKRP